MTQLHKMLVGTESNRETLIFVSCGANSNVVCPISFLFREKTFSKNVTSYCEQ